MSKRSRRRSFKRKKGTKLYNLTELLGEGSYGKVYLGIGVTDGKEFAIKVIPVESEADDVSKEIEILKQCSHENIVKYIDSFISGEDLWIIMEYCGGGSVRDLQLLLKEPLDEKSVAWICLCTLKGIQYLHSVKKIHRDIKPGNVLMSSNGDIKLADFGVSKQLTNTLSKNQTLVGTPYYMAPELITSEQTGSYTPGVDIWSVGITAIALVEENPPHHGVSPMGVIFLIPTKPSPKLKNPSAYSSEFNDFISKCLEKDVSKRPSAEELIQHPFCKNAKPNALISRIDRLNEFYIQHGGRENYIKKKNRNREDGDGDSSYSSSSGGSYSSSGSGESSSDDDDDEGEGEEEADTPLYPSNVPAIFKKKSRSNLDLSNFVFNEEFLRMEPSEDTKMVGMKEYVMNLRKKDVPLETLQKIKDEKYLDKELQKRIKLLKHNYAAKKRAVDTWIKFLSSKK